MKKSIPKLNFDKKSWQEFFEEVEVAEGWKKGKYTIKDENGKILGTYSSGGKAKKVMDDLMQKGDYPELTVSMVEEVEIDERDEWKNTRIQSKNIFKMLKQKHKNDIPKMKSGLELILKQNKTKPDQEKIMWQEFNNYFKIKEEVQIDESIHDKKSTFTMAPFEDLRGVADVALKIMQRQPQEVKEEEQEVTSEETPQQLTE